MKPLVRAASFFDRVGFVFCGAQPLLKPPTGLWHFPEEITLETAIEVATKGHAELEENRLRRTDKGWPFHATGEKGAAIHAVGYPCPCVLFFRGQVNCRMKVQRAQGKRLPMERTGDCVFGSADRVSGYPFLSAC